MYEKETKDSKYRDNPYRACNFHIDHDGFMVCPNGKRFHFLRSVPVKGNRFGRTEEYYQCEDCTGCTHREQCHKSEKNQVVRINEELTQFHNEVLDNLNSVHRHKTVYKRTEDPISGILHLLLGCYFAAPFLVGGTVCEIAPKMCCIHGCIPGVNTALWAG